MLDGLVCWLERWQELIAGVLGAAALVWTVRWTLLTERRRRDMETAALRVALGAELRMFAVVTLNVTRSIIRTVVNMHAGMPGPTVEALLDGIRFADPVIYPNTAASLGLIGNAAHEVEFFFFQMAVTRDAVARLGAGRQRLSIVEQPQLVAIAESALKAAETVALILPSAFTTGPYSENDRLFAETVKNARRELDSIKGT